jgi:hypothetical protein
MALQSKNLLALDPGAGPSLATTDLALWWERLSLSIFTP